MLACPGAAHLQVMEQLLGNEGGTFRVVTRNALYSIDLEARTVVRAGGGQLLPSNQSVFPLVEVLCVMVGFGMQLRVVADGAVRVLGTSTVHSISAWVRPEVGAWVRNAGTLGKAHRAVAGVLLVPGGSVVVLCGRTVHGAETTAEDAPAETDRCIRCTARSAL